MLYVNYISIFKKWVKKKSSQKYAENISPKETQYLQNRTEFKQSWIKA